MLLGLQFQFFPCGDLFGRRDHDHVAILAHAEAFGFQNDIQGLIPGDIFQSQSDGAIHRVAGDHVEAGKVSDKLKDRTHFNVLEVKREFFTGITEFIFLQFFLLFFTQWFDFNRQQIIGLIGEMFIIAMRCNDHTRPCSMREGVDFPDRGGKVQHIKFAIQALWQFDAGKIHQYLAAFFTNIRVNGGIRQLDNDTAFTLAATAKVYIIDL